MRVKLHNGLSKPQVIEATSVVVEDDFGNPLVMAVELEAHSYVFAKLGDAEFDPLLRQLGINKTVVINEVQSKPLSNVIWMP